MVNIELLSEKNFNAHSLDNYVRTQEVKRVYRRQNEEYVLVDMPYVEDWPLEKKRQVAQELCSEEYISYVALENGNVVGFIGLIRQLADGYMILDNMQVSAEHRRQGLGRKLFEMGKAEAEKAGAKALYISACPSEETIAFYMSMGAFVTKDIIKQIADDEPYDLQMACRI